MATMRGAVLAPDPLDLLTLVSSLRDVPAEAPSMDVLLYSFQGIVLPETTAMLAVTAEMIDNEPLRARLRREVAGRDHRLPGWLDRLHEVEVRRTLEMVHVLLDGTTSCSASTSRGGTSCRSSSTSTTTWARS